MISLAQDIPKLFFFNYNCLVLSYQFESRVEQLLKELKESKDKLVHQDQAAKNTIQQMQREMSYRFEQVRGHDCEHCH